jgi:hypothetical protein
LGWRLEPEGFAEAVVQGFGDAFEVDAGVAGDVSAVREILAQ